MSPRDVLLAAADAIEEHGWAQGWTRDGRLGAGQAIWTVSKNAGEETFRNRNTPFYWATMYVGRFVDWWNDEDGRTKDEVTAALRAAAERVSA